ncbi:cyclase family protein [Clostridium minihomine]|uniref:cyclase family protein n=1 Tax=Clostridium minihomine TaxID=2045012 RepID=UPI000C75D6B0|nr:cyclase family protein [Clostridium minihomine]
MTIYDISRELFSADVYPGDPIPYSERVRRIDTGDEHNLSAFFTGSHSGTHLDAPRHFIEDGDTIDRMSLEPFIGPCTVVTVDGLITGAQVEELLQKSQKRILFRGDSQAFLDRSAAFVLADSGATLVGTDAISIASELDERAVHLELLGAGIPVLEGLFLDDVPDGNYLLIALPLKLRGLEASPCRAVLLKDVSLVNSPSFWE